MTNSLFSVFLDDIMCLDVDFIGYFQCLLCLIAGTCRLTLHSTSGLNMILSFLSFFRILSFSHVISIIFIVLLILAGSTFLRMDCNLKFTGENA
jgi:hypothetical protein